MEQQSTSMRTRGPQKTHKKRFRPLFRTVYAKLLTIFVTVIALAMLLLVLLLGNLFRSLYVDQVYNQLLNECAHISEILPGWEDPERQDMVQRELELIARMNNAFIWIVYPDGQYKIVNDTNNPEWDDPKDIIKEDMMEEILQNAAEVQSISDNKVYQQRIMTAGRPYVRNNSEIVGAILMNVRISEISEIVNAMTANITLAISLAILASVIAISIIVHRFTRPLSDMNKVVRSYSTGNFTERVPVRSRDEIGQLATSFNAMAEDLEGLETMRRSFVANVSHELKSPLSSMRGFLQAVLDGSVPASESKEYLQIVHDETLRLNTLINDLLDLSKIESGEFPLNRTVFDANELIIRTLITFETRIEARKLDVAIDFAETRCMVYADADRVIQVFRNLIDNAIKYAGEGARLRLSSKRLPGKKRIEFEVADSGNGIPADDLLHIWERFYKVDKAHTPGGEGTGLGLPIVRQIIREHDCDIRAESEQGKGTRFVFTLPSEDEAKAKK